MYAKNLMYFRSLLKQYEKRNKNLRVNSKSKSKNTVKAKLKIVNSRMPLSQRSLRCAEFTEQLKTKRAVEYLFIKENLLRKLYKLRNRLSMVFLYKPELLIHVQLALKPIFTILYQQIIVTRKIAYNSLRLIYFKNRKSKLIGTYSGGTSLLIDKAKKTQHSIIDCGLRAGAAAVKVGITNIVLRLRSPENVWRLILKGLLMYVPVNTYYLDKQIAFNGCRGKKVRRL